MYSNPYKEIIKQVRFDNINDLFGNTIEIRRRIEKYVQRFPNGKFFPEEIIQYLTSEGDNSIKQLIISFLAKDPSRQSFHEKYAEYFLNQIRCLSKIIKLPKSGSNALYLAEGVMVSGQDIKDRGISKQKLTKSIDFSFIYLCIPHYVLHKYTEECGGSQDNQFNDVVNFLHKAREVTHDINGRLCKFVAILDGDYYRDKISNLCIKYPNIYISDITTLEVLLRNI